MLFMIIEKETMRQEVKFKVILGWAAAAGWGREGRGVWD